MFGCSPSWGTDPGMRNCTGEERTSSCEMGVAGSLDIVRLLA